MAASPGGNRRALTLSVCLSGNGTSYRPQWKPFGEGQPGFEGVAVVGRAPRGGANRETVDKLAGLLPDPELDPARDAGHLVRAGVDGEQVVAHQRVPGRTE